MGRFAGQYADQNERDHAQLAGAIAAGAVEKPGRGKTDVSSPASGVPAPGSGQGSEHRCAGQGEGSWVSGVANDQAEGDRACPVPAS